MPIGNCVLERTGGQGKQQAERTGAEGNSVLKRTGGQGEISGKADRRAGGNRDLPHGEK